MSQSQELIEHMLRYAINRCASICSNLNEETLGHERGPDCARKIKQEIDALVEETLKVHVPPSMTVLPASNISADVISWFATEEGKKSLIDVLAQAEASIALLNKERRVDPSLLHQPFGLEHDNRN